MIPIRMALREAEKKEVRVRILQNGDVRRIRPEADLILQELTQITQSVMKKRMEKEKPSFYAILPAEIRYNENLSHLEKLLYAEITALSNKNGYCYATNAWFSEHYGNSERTISRAISNLNDKGFIFTLFEQHGDKTWRKIYLREAAQEQIPYVFKDSDLPFGEGGRQKRLGGVDKNVVHNSTSSNNTSSTTSIISTPQKSTVALPTWMGKNSHARLGKLYELLFENAMGVPKHKLRLNGQNGVILKQLLEDYSEIVVAVMFIVHFEWKGLSGSDTSTLKKLKDNGFPLGWIPGNAGTYYAFITQTLKAKTDEDCEELVTTALKKLSSES